MYFRSSMAERIHQFEGEILAYDEKLLQNIFRLVLKTIYMVKNFSSDIRISKLEWLFFFFYWSFFTNIT